MKTTKIDQPPYVHNWARYNYPDELQTTKEIVAFIKGTPQITYAAGTQIIKDRISMKLDLETAIKAADSRGHKKSRPYVAEFVKAFYEYDAIRNYSGRPSYDQFVEPYRIGREIKIPVKPLIVISEGGVLKPIFVVGWATMPLGLFQRRLLMTVLEDAVFSLTDFQKSPGEFVSFPIVKGSNSRVRTPLVWQRGDYASLSRAEMNDQVNMYLRALARAKIIVSKGENHGREDEAYTESCHAAVDPGQGKLDL